MPEFSITCPVCQRVSHNPEDIKNRYCGACGRHDQTPVVEITTVEEFEALAAEHPLPPLWYKTPGGIERVMDNLARVNEDPPLGIIRVPEIAKDTYEVCGGALDGMVVKKIPENPTPEEEREIIARGVAFIMGEPPPEPEEKQ